MRYSFLILFLAVGVLGAGNGWAVSTQNGTQKTNSQVVGKPIQRGDVNLPEFHERHKEAIPTKGTTGKKTENHSSKTSSKKKSTNKDLGCDDNPYHIKCSRKPSTSKPQQNSN